MSVNVCRMPWDRPILAQAVEFVRKLYVAQQSEASAAGTQVTSDADARSFADNETQPDGLVDLSRLLIVMPSTRAANRLKELLAEAVASFTEAPTTLWFPPEVTTVGVLPELLYRPLRPFATASDQQFAWMKTFRGLSAADKRVLVPAAPDLDNLSFWHQLAEFLAKLSRELAANDLSFDSVFQKCQQLEAGADVARWRVLASLQQKYLATLDGLQLWDRQTARLYAIEHGSTEIQIDRTIILVGTVDLSVAMRKMLAFAKGPVHSLVFCDPKNPDGFDEFGCVETDAWCQANIDVGGEQIVLAESPEDQAIATIGLLGSARETYASDDVSLGIVDRGLVTTTQRHFEEAGHTTRWLGGQTIQATLPVMLLAALRRYLETSRFADLAAFVRHPDIKQWLERKGIDKQMLIGLDQFQNDSLPLNVSSGSSDTAQLSGAGDADSSQRLLPFDSVQPDASPEEAADGALDQTAATDATRPPTVETSDVQTDALLDGVQPLLQQIRQLLGRLTAGPTTWADLWSAVRQLLCEIYDEVSGDRTSPIASANMAALDAIANAIDELAQVPKPIVPRLKSHDGLRLIERLLEGGNYVSVPRTGQIEMLGWLDLPWEDASAAIVSGFNEGCVPAAVQGELFLPDQVRTALGLEDNERRYARDAYSLSLLARSKRWLRLVVGRRDSDKNPLTPSRLLFAVSGEEIGRRAKHLFRDSANFDSIWSGVRDAHRLAADQPAALATLQSDGSSEDNDPVTTSLRSTSLGRHRFRVPRPNPDVTIANEMSVTRFGDYLSCPYRFYLRHGLRLQSIEDQLDELQGNTFGTLMHAILDRFAKGRLAHATDALKIDEQLQQLVASEVARRFPMQAMPAVAIQVEQLRKRLTGFAHVQAKRTQAGWMIWESEISSLRAPLNVDGEPFYVTGRIDRIDQHRETGEFAVLDYKSSDKAKSPEMAHREKGEWINLQLPLYRHLIEQLPEVTGKVGVGYFSLPRETKDIRVDMASWSDSELQEADTVAADVVRGIRRHFYWPPREFNRQWEDPLDVICQVGTFDRHPEDIGTQESVVSLLNAEQPQQQATSGGSK